MAGSDIRAGRAFVEMFVSDSALVKGLNSAQAKLKAFGNAVKSIGIGLTGIGAGVLAPILGSAKQFAETGDALDKMSQRTGISVEKLSELSFAAARAGTTVEELETPIRKMQKAIVEASEGSHEAAIAIQSLGLNALDLRKMKPEEQFDAIAEKLMQIQDPALRAADTMKIFGKAGTSIIPIIENMKEATARAHALGATMSKEDVAAAVKLEEGYRDLKLALSGVANAIGSAVAPVLTGLLNKISLAVAAVSNWIRQNKTLVIATLATGAAIFAVGATFLAVGYTFVAFGTAFGAISAVVTSGAALISAAFGIMSTIVTTGILAMATAVGYAMAIVEIAVAAPMLVFVAIGAAIAIAAAAVLTLIGTFKSLWAAGTQTLNSLATTAKASFKAIADAIAAGDIELAFKIMTASVKLEWMKALQSIESEWEKFTKKIIPFKVGFEGSEFDELDKRGEADDDKAQLEIQRANRDLDKLKAQAREKAKAGPGGGPAAPNTEGIGEAIKAHSAGLFNVGNAATAFELGAGSGNWQKSIEESNNTLKNILKELKRDNGSSGVQLV